MRADSLDYKDRRDSAGEHPPVGSPWLEETDERPSGVTVRRKPSIWICFLITAAILIFVFLLPLGWRNFIESWYISKLQSAANDPERIGAIEKLSDVGGEKAFRAAFDMLVDKQRSTTGHQELTDPVSEAAFVAIVNITRKQDIATTELLVESVLSEDATRRALSLRVIATARLDTQEIQDALVTCLGMADSRESEGVFRTLHGIANRFKLERIARRNLSNKTVVRKLGGIRTLTYAHEYGMTLQARSLFDLYKTAQDPTEKLRREVAVALVMLGQCGIGAMEIVTDVLDTLEQDQLHEILYLLRLCDAIPPALCEKIRRLSRASTRSLVVALIEKCEEGDERGKRLIEALEDNDEGVRQSAVIALGKLQPPSYTAVLSLMRVARDDPATESVRLLAIRAIGEVGPFAKQAEDLLVELLRDEHGGIRQYAASALARINPTREKAVRALTRLIERENKTQPYFMQGVREAARESLRSLQAGSDPKRNERW